MQQQELFYKLFKKDWEDPANISMLQKEIEQYPYFGIPHFFELKLTDRKDENYSTIAANASVHFNNAYWLNIQLNKSADDAGSKQIAEKIKLAFSSQNDGLKNNEKQEDLLFEPLHTTDYFASQGIKLSEEALTNDKLGKQLKSFTDWLKTMKKINGEKLPEISGPVDSAVLRMAENSNMEAVVDTEAMAEVFVQQGKLTKAIEIYQKLSLQNPSKSAYFAKKIDSLKKY
jgi:hypothetical protein